MQGNQIANWITDPLTCEQRDPFTCASNRISILAAAGSGKTRTLTHLIAQDICSGIPASSIVAFTFTNKAADELLARVHALILEHMPVVDLSGIFVGTIHSWCFEYLQTQSEFYNFTPVDELHAGALASRLYDVLKLGVAYDKPFPKGIEPFRTDIEIFYNEHLATEDVPPEIAPSLVDFMELLRASRLVTFGGMIRHAIEQLETNGPVLDLLSLYVDEYQDVNPAQTALIRAMLPDDATLRVVGDDLQSIYNWRGSDVTRILDFPKEFKPATLFRLSTNFRSRPQLIDVANAVADDIQLKDPNKIMRPGRLPTDHRNVHWLSTKNDTQQASTIVEIVNRFHSNGTPYSAVAILLRSVMGAGVPIYEALIDAGIPVECPTLSRGGTFIISFLMPVIKWICTDQKEPRNREELETQENHANALWQLAEPWIKVQNSESTFWEELNGWYDLTRQGTSASYNVRSNLYDFLDACGIRVTSDDGDLMVGIGIASQIIRSVEEVHRRRIPGHARRSAVGVVREVYHALSRNHSDYGESLPINNNANGVVLSTIHQAKGLEWPIVILPTLNRRRFPLANRTVTNSFPPSVSLRYGTTLDDERRLFYVAVTRAREQLFLLDTASAMPTQRSIFLDDLQRRSVLPEEGMPESEDTMWRLSIDVLNDDTSPPLRIGLSDLLLHMECPFQFSLRRVAGIQPAVGDELGFGLGLHELLQRRTESDSSWDEEEAKSQVNRYVHMPLSSNETEVHAKRTIKNRLVQLEELGAFDGDIQQELPVQLLFNGCVVTGVIDFVLTQYDGSLLIRDWKANLHDEFLPRYTRQLQLYAYALRSQDHTVNRAELVDVSATSKSGRLVAVNVDVGDFSIAQIVQECQNALIAIQKGRYSPRPSPETCGRCDVRRVCAEREGATLAKT